MPTPHLLPVPMEPALARWDGNFTGLVIDSGPFHVPCVSAEVLVTVHGFHARICADFLYRCDTDSERVTFRLKPRPEYCVTGFDMSCEEKRTYMHARPDGPPAPTACGESFWEAHLLRLASGDQVRVSFAFAVELVPDVRGAARLRLDASLSPPLVRTADGLAESRHAGKSHPGATAEDSPFCVRTDASFLGPLRAHGPLELQAPSGLHDDVVLGFSTPRGSWEFAEYSSRTQSTALAYVCHPEFPTTLPTLVLVLDCAGPALPETKTALLTFLSCLCLGNFSFQVVATSRNGGRRLFREGAVPGHADALKRAAAFVRGAKHDARGDPGAAVCGAWDAGFVAHQLVFFSGRQVAHSLDVTVRNLHRTTGCRVVAVVTGTSQAPRTEALCAATGGQCVLMRKSPVDLLDAARRVLSPLQADVDLDLSPQLEGRLMVLSPDRVQHAFPGAWSTRFAVVHGKLVGGKDGVERQEWEGDSLHALAVRARLDSLPIGPQRDIEEKGAAMVLGMASSHANTVMRSVDGDTDSPAVVQFLSPAASRQQAIQQFLAEATLRRQAQPAASSSAPKSVWCCRR